MDSYRSGIAKVVAAGITGVALLYLTLAGGGFLSGRQEIEQKGSLENKAAYVCTIQEAYKNWRLLDRITPLIKGRMYAVRGEIKRNQIDCSEHIAPQS